MNIPDLIFRYMLLLIFSAVAGFASGIFYLSSMGVRGAILGASLCLGIITINFMEQNNFLSDLPPRIFSIIFSAIFAGLLAGVLLNTYGTGAENSSGDFPPMPTTQGYPTIAVSISYSLLIHIAYIQRWKIKDK